MLDYKYIEQLIDRYFECETTLEEEAILRDFFAQDDIPVALLQYRQLFVYEHAESKVDTLGEDFDERIMNLIDEETPVKARTISLSERLRPLLKAAAVVAVFITIGTAVETSLKVQEPVATTRVHQQEIRKEGSVAQSDSTKSQKKDAVKAEAVPVMIK